MKILQTIKFKFGFTTCLILSFSIYSTTSGSKDLQLGGPQIREPRHAAFLSQTNPYRSGRQGPGDKLSGRGLIGTWCCCTENLLLKNKQCCRPSKLFLCVNCVTPKRCDGDAPPKTPPSSPPKPRPPPPRPTPPPARPPPPGPAYTTCMRVGDSKCCAFSIEGARLCFEISRTGALQSDGRCCSGPNPNEYCCGDECLQRLQECYPPWVDLPPGMSCLNPHLSFYHCCSPDERGKSDLCPNVDFRNHEECCQMPNPVIYCCASYLGCRDWCTSASGRAGRRLQFDSFSPFGRMRKKERSRPAFMPG